MRIIKFMLFFVLTFNLVEAQNWVSLAGGALDWEGRVLYPDSQTGNLFVGGNLTTVDGHHSWEISAWDGSNWDTSYSFGTYGGGSITSIVRYQNDLYTCGFIEKACNKYILGFTRWNGNCWDSLITNHRYNLIEDLCEYNNLLFMTGGIDTVSNIYSPMTIAWNGNNWVPNGLPHSDGSGPEVCCVYHNGLYFAGAFGDSLGLLYGFVKFDGSNWSMPSPGFGGLIHSMAVYHDELYIGGNYFGGGPSDFIVKWNGSSLSSVGTQFKGSPYHLRVIGDKLFAVGILDSINGISVNHNIAVWDGNNWSRFSNDTFNNNIMDVAVYNNELYAVGSFSMINSDSIGGVAKYQGWHLGENDLKKKKEAVEVYPIPASSSITVKREERRAQHSDLTITDVYGRVVYKETYTTPDTKIDILHWSEGVYFYEVRSIDGSTRGKFVVHH